jgi:hypothetical protein
MGRSETTPFCMGTVRPRVYFGIPAGNAPTIDIWGIQDYKYNNVLNCQNGQVTHLFLSSSMRRKHPPVTILPLDEIIHSHRSTIRFNGVVT